MEIRINNTVFKVPENYSLKTLLDEQGLIGNRGIAIAVNDDVMSKDNWSDYTLKPDDNIIIIRATQGG